MSDCDEEGTRAECVCVSALSLCSADSVLYRVDNQEGEKETRAGLFEGDVCGTG